MEKENNNNNTSEEIPKVKEGQGKHKYNLTPLQVMLINKLMPNGFKLESQEFIDKVNKMHQSKGAPKRHKHRREFFKDDYYDDSPKRKKNKNLGDTDMSFDTSNQQGLKRSAREKKPNNIEDLGYVEKIHNRNAKNPIYIDSFKKCEKGLSKLKKHPLVDFYLNIQNKDAPSISQVEKNVKSYQYNSIYQFANDIRKIWAYFYTNHSNNPDIYNRTCNIAHSFEEIFKEMEHMNEEKTQYQELSKQVERLTKEMNQVKGSVTYPVTAPTKKQDSKMVSTMEKPLSIQEKNQLGSNIRQLNHDQLKGILNILSDTFDIESNSKFFEFDIESLPTRKLRELEKYVKNCLKSKGGVAAISTAKPIQPKSNNLTENDKLNKLKVNLF
jgi:hypothetical protein